MSVREGTRRDAARADFSCVFVRYSTLRGVVLKYNEPPEARKPTKNWRLYAFKGKEQVGEYSRSSDETARGGPRALTSYSNADLFHVHRQSAYLIGRDRIVSS